METTCARDNARMADRYKNDKRSDLKQRNIGSIHGDARHLRREHIARTPRHLPAAQPRRTAPAGDYPLTTNGVP